MAPISATRISSCVYGRSFNPDQWANLFAQSGARYIVFTAKFHDGYALWPSRYSWNWNSVDLHPHRDLVDELDQGSGGAGLKMGFYYSLYEWYNPLYLKDPKPTPSCT